MQFFRDFIIVSVIVGITTRLGIWLFNKKLDEKTSMAISYFLTMVIIGPIAVVYLGFDVAIAEFVLSVIMWSIFDLLRIEYKKKGR